MKHLKYFENNSTFDPYIYDDPNFVNLIEEVIDKGGSFYCTSVANAIRMMKGMV